ncbi:MAG: Hint domain-containing protein [Litoreibacter sp.]|nr:Hint domain-containing protein [Litoreibacter sp.]
MTGGVGGAFVLSSKQTFLDGMPCRADSVPRVGQVWSWKGEATNIEGGHPVLLLKDTVVPGQIGAVPRSSAFYDDVENGFVVSDGVRDFAIVPVTSRSGEHVLYWCPSGLPTVDRVYTVIRSAGETAFFRQTNDFGGDVICFTTGTQIRTPNGSALVEDLCVGDAVQTKDNGAQKILWIGHRRMTGARLHAMPDLRPVRLRASALDADVPDADLLVSPHHRMLYSGPNAQALFNQPEVLIKARDLLNDHSVFVDYAVREVTYVHLLLEEHQILWANGVQTESYHPANTTLQTIEEHQRADLLNLFPYIAADPYSYGPYARRNLDRSEAAILMHDFS